ncbi:hypothetical protein [Flavobacterium sp. HJSW_4]|uniref:hypothetical protein n=1 Tax=Flavobacterium sp. HJSW_4 TaxID=3344660 RepID=UPI0035F37147
MNNNYLVSSDSTAVQPDDILVQENASIFHDYGQISNNGKIQTSIPKNNTY